MILARFEFAHGTLLFTEASSKKRASMQVDQSREALTRENHTIKRALTDPHLLSGIGNAYSDEILHAAKLSPLKWRRPFTATEATCRG
jgi:formamidopyrimidine-DNA glycosylase